MVTAIRVQANPTVARSVAVVDDDEDTLLYFSDLLASTGDFSCLGRFSTGARALLEIPCLNPDLVLMDIRLPDVNGIECARRLKLQMPGVKIIMLTAMHDANSIQKSLDAGADAYLTKPGTAEQCLAALRFADRDRLGLKGLPPGIEQSPKRAGSRATLPPITDREGEVMGYLAAGLLYKEIADRMRISFSAVHKHQHNVFRKLGAGNRTEAVIAWRQGHRASL